MQSQTGVNTFQNVSEFLKFNRPPASEPKLHSESVSDPVPSITTPPSKQIRFYKIFNGHIPTKTPLKSVLIPTSTNIVIQNNAIQSTTPVIPVLPETIFDNDTLSSRDLDKAEASLAIAVAQEIHSIPILKTPTKTALRPSRCPVDSVSSIITTPKSSRNVSISRLETQRGVVPIGTYQGKTLNIRATRRSLTPIIDQSKSHPSIECQVGVATRSNVVTVKDYESRGDTDSIKRFLIDQQSQLPASVVGKSGNGKYQLKNDGNTLIYENVASSKRILYDIIRPQDIGLQENVKSLNLKRQRLSKQSGEPVLMRKSTPSLMTRSGRVSRPPTYMKTFVSDPTPPPVERIIAKKLVTTSTAPSPAKATPISQIDGPKIKRNIPEYFRCNTCNKIYLGVSKRKKHLLAHPDHDMPNLPPPTSNVPSNIFDFFMSKLQDQPKGADRQMYFFNELSQFVAKCNDIHSKLLGCRSDGTSVMQYIDKNVSKLFGIQEGNYYVNVDALLEKVNVPSDNIHSTSSSSSPKTDSVTNVDYNQLTFFPATASSFNDGGSRSDVGVSDESLFEAVHNLDLERLDVGKTHSSQIIELNFGNMSDNAIERPVTPTQLPILDFSNLINS